MDPSVTPETPPAPQPQGGYVERRRAAALEAIRASQPKPDPAPAPAETPVALEAPVPPPVETPAPEPKDDLAAARKQEIHLRRQMAERERELQAEFERKQAEYKPKLDEYETLKAKIAAAQDDPIGYLELGGWTADRLGDLARMAYAHSPEGLKDPRNKTAAHQTKAQREYEQKLAKLEERQTAFERAQQEQRELAELQARVDGYYGTISKAVGDDSPIVRSRLAAAPDAARERLLAIADKLYVESGPSDDLRDVPEPAAIVKAYEAERNADLEADLRALPPAALTALLKKLGVDPATALQTNGAPVKPAAPTLTPGAPAPTPTASKGRKSRDELIADVRRLASVAKQ